jgi:S1-C subfamily serine protease
MLGAPARPNPRPVSAGREYFYELGGQQQGPIALAELRRLASDGALTPKDRIWTEGMTTWQEAEKAMPNLFGVDTGAHSKIADRKARWGFFVFCGVSALTLLLFIGFLIWRGGRNTNSEPVAENTVQATQPQGSSSPTSTLLTPEQIFEKCSPAVAQVRNKAGSGSGFLVRPNVVVTNAHVVEDDFVENLRVSFPSIAGTKDVPATLLHYDRKRDLAVLGVQTKLSPLFLAGQEPKQGQQVVVIGSPGIVAAEVAANTITHGTLTNKLRLPGHDDEFYQIDAAINHGNSGGPVFNARGEVIGVATLSLRGKQAMNYAIPFPEVAKAIDAAQARTRAQVDQISAEYDASVIFRTLGKASSLYQYGMAIYANSMQLAVKKGEKPDVGWMRASAAIDAGIEKGVKLYFGKRCEEALPSVVGNKSLPPAAKDQLKQLHALFLEMKDWFDNPRELAGYPIKTRDCGEKMSRLFASLRLELGVNEDPRLDEDELKALGLPH